MYRSSKQIRRSVNLLNNQHVYVYKIFGDISRSVPSTSRFGGAFPHAPPPPKSPPMLLRRHVVGADTGKIMWIHDVIDDCCGAINANSSSNASNINLSTSILLYFCKPENVFSLPNVQWARLVGWLVFDGTFSANRLYRAMEV